MTERAIDSRYPPFPKSPLRVPLYPDHLPNSEAVESDIEDVEAALITSLATSIGISSNALTAGDSVSALVREFILHSPQNNDEQRIAVPHYSCQSLVDAIIDANATPVFYDIEEDATVSERGVQFALSADATTFIWPVYFGDSKRDPYLLSILHENNIPVIFDDAQADFLSVASQQTRDAAEASDVVLYSFGTSKLLAGSGGAALYSNIDNDTVTLIKNSLSDELPQSSHEPLISSDQSKFSTQLELLEARHHQGASRSRITERNASTTLKQLERYLILRSKHTERYETVREVIIENLGEAALCFVKGIQGVPSILAVRVPESERYKTLVNLSSEGIQSTWYYHPINRVSRYRKYTAQEDYGSAIVANSVVVLPFQWKHSSEQVNILVEALQKIGGA